MNCSTWDDSVLGLPTHNKTIFQLTRPRKHMLEHAFNYLLILATLCNMVTKSSQVLWSKSLA